MIRNFQQNLDKLYYFYSVAKNESFNAAARELHISQPALSYAVRDLESVLNVSLLTRDRSGTSVTPEGRQLMEVCSQIFDELGTMEKRIANAGSSPMGTVEFGTYDCYIQFFWTGCYSVLRLEFPKLDIRLHTEVLRENIVEGLFDRKFDMAMVAGEIKERGISGCGLYKDSFGFFVSTKRAKTHWLRKDPKEINALNDLPLIFERLDKTPYQSNFFHEKLAEIGITAPPAMSVRGIEVVKALTVAGFGIGILPYWHVEQELRKKQLRELQIKKVAKGTLCPHELRLYWQSGLDDCHSIQLLRRRICSYAESHFP